MSDKKTANFFWHGELTNLEKSCINSFVMHGFDVNLWSYQNHTLPNVMSRDASLLLPESDIKKYTYSEELKTIQKSSGISAFANIFRYKLLENGYGWWFDTDCFCLKRVEEFCSLENDFIVGIEQDDIPNNAVIYSKIDIAADLLKFALDRIKDTNYVSHQWGLTGPWCIKDFVLKNGILPLEQRYFYPVRPNDCKMLITPKSFNYVTNLIKDSFILHVWDVMLVKRGIDKNNPPEGSILEHLIKQYSLQ
jgi:hypothetical protein